MDTYEYLFAGNFEIKDSGKIDCDPETLQRAMEELRGRLAELAYLAACGQVHSVYY